jgi:hypothetical protein
MVGASNKNGTNVVLGLILFALGKENYNMNLLWVQ